MLQGNEQGNCKTLARQIYAATVTCFSACEISCQIGNFLCDMLLLLRLFFKKQLTSKFIKPATQRDGGKREKEERKEKKNRNEQMGGERRTIFCIKNTEL